MNSISPDTQTFLKIILTNYIERFEFKQAIVAVFYSKYEKAPIVKSNRGNKIRSSYVMTEISNLLRHPLDVFIKKDIIRMLEQEGFPQRKVNGHMYFLGIKERAEHPSLEKSPASQDHQLPISSSS